VNYLINLYLFFLIFSMPNICHGTDNVAVDLNLDILANSCGDVSVSNINRNEEISLFYILQNNEESSKSTAKNVKLIIKINPIFETPNTNLSISSPKNRVSHDEFILFIVPTKNSNDYKLDVYNNGTLELDCSELKPGTNISFGYKTRISKDAECRVHEMLHKNRIQSRYDYSPNQGIKADNIEDIKSIHIYDSPPIASSTLNISSPYSLAANNSSLTVPIGANVTVECLAWDDDNLRLNCSLYDNLTCKNYKLKSDPENNRFIGNVIFNRSGTHCFTVIANSGNNSNTTLCDKICIVKNVRWIDPIINITYIYLLVIMVLWGITKWAPTKMCKFNIIRNWLIDHKNVENICNESSFSPYKFKLILPISLYILFNIPCVVILYHLNPNKHLGYLGNWFLASEYIIFLIGVIISDIIIYKYNISQSGCEDYKRHICYMDYEDHIKQVLATSTLLFIFLLLFNYWIFESYLMQKSSLVHLAISFIVISITAKHIRSTGFTEINNLDNKNLFTDTFVLVSLSLSILFIITETNFIHNFIHFPVDYNLTDSINYFTLNHLITLTVFTELPMIILILIPGIIYNNIKFMSIYIIPIIMQTADIFDLVKKFL